ncbi:MAG: endo-1,4-beta-xylanase [Treponema sp.]|jgi:endo-1,4-beta-xylanase|nr:endo-1,4-beta-xylanase [Treponema sp.]
MKKSTLCAIVLTVLFSACAGQKVVKQEPVQEPVGVAESGYAQSFETDNGGFFPRGGEELLTLSTESAHSGNYSLKVENRSKAWHGPSVRIEQYLEQGKEYTLSLWVKLISPNASQLQLSTQVGEGNAASYSNIARADISTASGWLQLAGTYRYDNTSSGYITVYVESSTDAPASFYIDDVQVSELISAPLVLEDLPPLKARYEGTFLIGNVIAPTGTSGQRFELLKKHFNILTAENAMKPSSLQHDKGVFTFEDVDKMIDTVRAEGFKVHGHTLAWHQQSSEWMNYDGISRDEAIDNLVTHAKTVAGHFSGKVISWDVLNEAIVDNPQHPTDWKASLRQSPWYKAIGPDYVEIVFKAAREADPEAMLYYNDYNLDNQNKSLAVYSMVKDINERNPQVNGRPLIDGIGMQGHYVTNTNPTNVRLSIERFISLGVEVSITELDIQAGSNSQLTEKQALQQGIAYANLFKIFKEYAQHIGRVTLWGLEDSSSWRAATNPLLFDKDLHAKPAFYAASDPERFIAQNEALLPQDAKRVDARYGTPTIDGAVESLWNGVPSVNVDQQLMAWQGATGTAQALWDDSNLYVLITVTGAELNKANTNAYEQDSVEIFVDENNHKTSFYEEDDGQFRVNFANEATFNPASVAGGFVSAATVSGKSYTVEIKIPFKHIQPADGTEIGYDIQINGASASGIRQSVAIWNDLTGNGYQDTSGYGILTLTAK